jgi:hypothetical protein
VCLSSFLSGHARNEGRERRRRLRPPHLMIPTFIGSHISFISACYSRRKSNFLQQNEG